MPSCATAEVPAAKINTNVSNTTCGENDRDFTLDFLSANPSSRHQSTAAAGANVRTVISYRPCSRCLNRYDDLHDARRMPIKCSAKCVIFRAGVLGILSRLWKSRQFRHLERSQVIEVFVNACNTCRQVSSCSRVSTFAAREGDIQIASSNRLSLFLYFVRHDVT